MSRLIVVSNRVVAKNATAVGGLPVTLLSALCMYQGVWFGWNGEICSADDPSVAIETRDRVTSATIALPERLCDQYYNGFANSALWPLFHDLLGDFRYESADYAAYIEVNDLFALKLASLVRTGDLIWAHDYHLIPLAEKLRAHKINNPIGHFLHSPFPPFEALRALPAYAQCVSGFLAYDLLGFQTEISRQHFLVAVSTTCGSSAVIRENVVYVNGRSVRTCVLPVGIDVNTVARDANTAIKSDLVSNLMKSLQGSALILGVDRLDYSKGLIERFNGYERFLDLFPESRGKIVLLQISPLSRGKVESYARMRATVEQVSGRINGRFAEADWTPIRYLNRHYPHSVLMGLMRASRVCLVTALQDGMNLVAKEYLVAQDPDDPGVLVLSNRTGAAHELMNALVVNPYDADGVAQALHDALSMTHIERRSRHARLLANVKQHDLRFWHDSFVDLLRGTRDRSVAHRSPESFDVRSGT